MARPIHKNNPRYAVLTVDKPGEGVGLANGGTDGIALKGGDAYEVSRFAHQLFMNDAWGPDNKMALPRFGGQTAVRESAQSGIVSRSRCARRSFGFSSFGSNHFTDNNLRGRVVKFDWLL